MDCPTNLSMHADLQAERLGLEEIKKHIWMTMELPASPVVDLQKRRPRILDPQILDLLVEAETVASGVGQRATAAAEPDTANTCVSKSTSDSESGSATELFGGGGGADDAGGGSDFAAAAAAAGSVVVVSDLIQIDS